MAYVEVDNSQMWSAQEHLQTCPELMQMNASDTPYFAVDFSAILDGAGDNSVSILGTITEVDSKTITLDNTGISNTSRIVSFRVASNGGAGDYKLRVPVTLSEGASHVVSRICILRVV